VPILQEHLKTCPFGVQITHSNTFTPWNRVGQNRRTNIGLAKIVRTKISGFVRTKIIWICRRIVSVTGNFRPCPYPYDRTWVMADRTYTPYVQSKPYKRRIWAVYAGGAVRIPATAVYFALFCSFWSIFLFSRLFLLSSSFASLFY